MGTGHGVEDILKTKFYSLGIGLEDPWPWPWPWTPLALASTTLFLNPSLLFAQHNVQTSVSYRGTITTSVMTRCVGMIHKSTKNTALYKSPYRISLPSKYVSAVHTTLDYHSVKPIRAWEPKTFTNGHVQAHNGNHTIIAVLNRLWFPMQLLQG